MDKLEKVGSFEEAWRSQVLAGLSVSPAERLHWLEEAVEFASRAGALTYDDIVAPRHPMNAQQSIDEMIRRIVARFDPEKVILFGSQARGDARAGSDVDLLVVFSEIDGSRRQKCVDIRAALHDIRVPKDVLVATEDEMEREKDIPGTISRIASREGRTLYERGH